VFEAAPTVTVGEQVVLDNTVVADLAGKYPAVLVSL
jgi:hypothetical protein